MNACENISIDEVIARLIDGFSVEQATPGIAAVLGIEPWRAKMYAIGALDRVDEVSLIYVISRVEKGHSAFTWLTADVGWEKAKEHFVTQLVGSIDEPARVRLLTIPAPQWVLNAVSERVDIWLNEPGMAELIEREIPAKIDVTVGMEDHFSALIS